MDGLGLNREKRFLLVSALLLAAVAMAAYVHYSRTPGEKHSEIRTPYAGQGKVLPRPKPPRDLN